MDGASAPFLNMVIYLKHPLHGAKVAIAEAEAEQDELNGWQRFNPDTPLDTQAAPVQQEVTNQLPRRRSKQTAA